MPALLWLPVLAKALSTALVVVFASVLAEFLGPFWGALVGSLPVSAGPAYIFLAMQHDSDFVAASALTSFAANAATGAFLIVYAALARRLLLRPALSVAVVVWLVTCLVIRQIAWTPITATLLNLIVYGAGFLLLKRLPMTTPQETSVTKRHWFDLPLRAATIAVFVSAVVVVSSRLGPYATGVAAVFPISLTSLIIILRPRIGGAASALLAATALRAMLGFGFALLVLHLAVQPWGAATALLLALLVTILWSCGLFLLKGYSRLA